MAFSEEFVRNLPGLSPETLAEIERGQMPQCRPLEGPEELGTQEMVEAGFAANSGCLTITIPCITRSEANESSWMAKMRRKLPAKRATREALAPCHGFLNRYVVAYHSDRALRIVFTRLGGRRLDKGNLPSSLKAVEDVVAAALLADDGSPKWHVSYEQIPGGPLGVRVEISVMEDAK